MRYGVYIGLGTLCLVALIGCSDASKSKSASRAGATAALEEVGMRYRTAQAQPLLMPDDSYAVCGASGHYTLYGTVHHKGGFANGMWSPPHEVPVVYRGITVRQACP